jgi:hypothetical protein
MASRRRSVNRPFSQVAAHAQQLYGRGLRVVSLLFDIEQLDRDNASDADKYEVARLLVRRNLAGNLAALLRGVNELNGLLGGTRRRSAARMRPGSSASSRG